MSVTVRPASASLYTQAVFAVLSALEKSGLNRVDLILDSSVDLVGEMQERLRIVSTRMKGFGSGLVISRLDS